MPLAIGLGSPPSSDKSPRPRRRTSTYSLRRLLRSSLENFAVLRLARLHAPAHFTCVLTLFNGKLPLMVSFRRAGTTGPSKFVGLSASPATSFVSSESEEDRMAPSVSPPMYPTAPSVSAFRGPTAPPVSPLRGPLAPSLSPLRGLMTFPVSSLRDTMAPPVHPSRDPVAFLATLRCDPMASPLSPLRNPGSPLVCPPRDPAAPLVSPLRCPAAPHSFLHSCDADCSSSSCTSSCREPSLTSDSSSPGFTPGSSSPSPLLPVLPGPSILCIACRFDFTCERASRGPD